MSAKPTGSRKIAASAVQAVPATNLGMASLAPQIFSPVFTIVLAALYLIQ